MKNKKGKDVVIIEKEKIETVFIVIFLGVMILLLGSYLIKGVTTVKNIEQETETVKGIEKSAFIDKELNITVLYPNRWILTEIDNTVIESKKESISEVAASRLFDLSEHRLDDEVISFLLVNNPSVNTDGSQSHSQFMSLTLMGDVNMGEDEKLDFLENRFTDSIEIANRGTDYNFEIVKANKTPDGGYYIEGNIDVDGRTIYYAQYAEVKGLNIATALMGSSIEDETMYDKVFEVINSIKKRQ